jgi:hypothetical protein
MPIADIARKHHIQFHSYADDTQLYMTVKPSDIETEPVLESLQACIKNIRSWMTMHKLKLNCSKTEVLFIASPHVHRKLLTNGGSVVVGEDIIASSEQAKNLGVIFDKCMNMEGQIKSICQACYLQLRNIRSIQTFLSKEALSCLVHAFISSRLDYCNSLLFGAPDHLINKLQRIQNMAARIVTNTSKYDHITPILHSLHWLPVKYRIQYKILLLVYRTMNGLAPSYLEELIHARKTSRVLRSNNKILLDVPRSHLKTYGENSFAVCGPKLWNMLPLHLQTASSIDTFKCHLKTHLFKIAYM